VGPTVRAGNETLCISAPVRRKRGEVSLRSLGRNGPSEGAGAAQSEAIREDSAKLQKALKHHKEKMS
jgi:hypothetical protein